MTTYERLTDFSPKKKMRAMVPAKTPTAKGSIIWAVAPDIYDAGRTRSIGRLIETWRQNFPGEVLPVSVVSPSELNWPAEFVAPLEEKLVELTTETLKPAVRAALPDTPIAPHILLESGFSHRKAARMLLDFAKRNRARVIVMFTHGRRGVERFALGSFAELLISQDVIPVLALNPTARVPVRIDSIGFPTDFSEVSLQGFEEALKFAKQANAKLKLIHVFTFPSHVFSNSDFGFGVDANVVEATWKAAEIEQERKGRSWASLANDRGVETEFVFSKDYGRPGELVTKICDERKVDMIYLTTAYGRMGQTFLGGTIRDVLATAPVPVLIRHFRQKRG